MRAAILHTIYIFFAFEFLFVYMVDTCMYV